MVEEQKTKSPVAGAERQESDGASSLKPPKSVYSARSS